MSAPENLFMLCVNQTDLDNLSKVLPSIKFVHIVGKEFEGVNAICTPFPPKPEEAEIVSGDVVDDQIDG